VISAGWPIQEKNDWRKARRSLGNGECVEVVQVKSGVAVRDSRNKAGTMLVYSRVQWSSFVADIKT
jgi:hypothetical protein